jgi:hypothetical protein
MNAIQILIAVRRANGNLQVDSGGLSLYLPPDAEPALIQQAREAKPELLRLFGLSCLVVKSDTLRGHAFWVPDPATKQELIDLGAHPTAVWTRDELAQVCNERPSADGLRSMVATRRKDL